MGKSLESIMQETNPVTSVNGVPVLSFREQRDLAEDMAREHIEIPTKYNPDGTIARTGYSSTAINLGIFYDNRYKKAKDKLYVVSAQTTDGYWAIKEQTSGRVPFKQIPAFVFARKDDQLVYVETVTVSDDSFLADFTHKLSEDAMKQLLPLIPASADAVADDELPI